MKRSRRRLSLEVLESRLLFALDTPASRNEVVDMFYSEYQVALGPASAWTGNTASCSAGGNSAAFTNATLQMVNYYRNMAGLPDVSLDPVLNQKAQQAALMMDAANALSHTPGPGWACYTADGAEAAGKSNLYLGRSGADAIAGYVEDPGIFNNIVGHRRWILYPRQTALGTGSTNRANALWVIGTQGPRPDTRDFIAWPPPGYVPYEVVYPRWSFSVNESSYDIFGQPRINFDAATVRMTRGGSEIALNVVARNHEGYGDFAIVWEPQGLNFQAGMSDQTIRVQISNVAVGGVASNFTYDVTLIDPARAASSQIGFHRDNRFYLDANGNHAWNQESGGDRILTFGAPGDTPLVGDWDGDGDDDIGFQRGNRFYLDLNGNGRWDPAAGDSYFAFGAPGDQPVIGDWDGDGDDDLGFYRGNRFYLDLNGNRRWDPAAGDNYFALGAPGDRPVVGDWNGDGVDDLGFHRGNRFYLDVNGNRAWNGTAGGDALYTFGAPGDTPLAGDWDGDGDDDIGFHRDNRFYLDLNDNGVWNSFSGGDVYYAFGAAGDRPLVGAWAAPALAAQGAFAAEARHGSATAGEVPPPLSALPTALPPWVAGPPLRGGVPAVPGPALSPADVDPAAVDAILASPDRIPPGQGVPRLPAASTRDASAPRAPVASEDLDDLDEWRPAEPLDDGGLL